MPEFRTGLIALIGRPNVGKSTLINALVGQKVSITSRKAQTTRHRVRGVLTRPDAQYVFVDTPGLQWERRSLLSDRMNAAATSLIGDVDAVGLVIDARGWRPEDDRIVGLLPRVGDGPSHVVLIINKIDQLPSRDRLLPLIEASRHRYPFADIVPVSAERGDQLDELLAVLRAQLAPGQPLFEQDQLTDRSVRSKGRAVIGATIWVERESHRGIVIGAGGGKMKEIGRLARLEIEPLLEKPVHLDLWVKLCQRWRDDAAQLARLGYGLRE